jgi:hypothetical protein
VKRKPPTLLGIHGLVFSSAEPEALAKAWSRLTGLAVLRHSGSEIVLGGPELFVTVRRARWKAAGADALEEVHLAAEEIGKTGRKSQEDSLGGDSWSCALGPVTLVVREFRRPPAGNWRRRRPRIDSAT